MSASAIDSTHAARSSGEGECDARLSHRVIRFTLSSRSEQLVQVETALMPIHGRQTHCKRVEPLRSGKRASARVRGERRRVKERESERERESGVRSGRGYEECAQSKARACRFYL